MTREIKFRGKATHGALKGQWVYGSFVNYPGNPAIINIRGSYNIDPITLGQSINLKDHKQNDIFEGDIVKSYNDNDCFGDIFFDAECSLFNVRNFHNTLYDYPTLAFSENLKVQIIGNMHDNPKLLEVSV